MCGLHTVRCGAVHCGAVQCGVMLCVVFMCDVVLCCARFGVVLCTAGAERCSSVWQLHTSLLHTTRAPTCASPWYVPARTRYQFQSTHRPRPRGGAGGNKLAGRVRSVGLMPLPHVTPPCTHRCQCAPSLYAHVSPPPRSPPAPPCGLSPVASSCSLPSTRMTTTSASRA